MRKYSILLAAIIALASQTAQADSESNKGIRMLPPVQSGTTDENCWEHDGTAFKNPEGNKILTWDGKDAIKCNKNVTIDSSGRLGVGTQNPSAKLDIIGSLKVSTDSTVCGPSTGGALRYNNTTKVMEYCNESAWTTISTGASDCKVYHADTTGAKDGGILNIYSHQMLAFTCPAERPKMLSGSCWRKENGDYIGTHNLDDGSSYLCRIEGNKGLDVWVTCCK